MMVERVPGSRTVLVNNPNWWGNANKVHNLTKATFVPIANAATRVSALLTGEVDMIFPVSLQDINRVNATPGVKAMQGPELRTIFLGFDQHRDELLDMKGSGKNPFKDVRVRRAFLPGHRYPGHSQKSHARRLHAQRYDDCPGDCGMGRRNLQTLSL
jgi:peptide/nickel transport system substrate-binding protein